MNMYIYGYKLTQLKASRDNVLHVTNCLHVAQIKGVFP